MSNINLLKKALRNDLNPFGNNSNNKKLQVVLEQPCSDNFKALSDRLAQSKQTTEIDLIDFITASDFPLLDTLDFFIQELPRLKRINIIVENLSARQNLSSYISIINGAPKTGLKYSFTFPVSVNIKSKKQFSTIFNEQLKSFLQSLLKKDIPVRCLFVLNPKNCLYADDALLFYEACGIDQFLFIPSNKTNPSNFASIDRFHTAQFFKKLAKFNSPDFAYSNYYKNLFLEYSKLKPDVTYKIKSTPKSIDQNGKEVNGLDYDLNFIPSLGLNDFTQRGFKKVTGRIRRNIITTQPSNFETGTITIPKIQNPKDWKRVLITGWYGTETAGDKAILGEILHFIKSSSPDCKIILTTIFDHVSHQTNLELDDLKNVQLVEIKKGHLPSCIEKVDAVIMGGGPLMESQSMLNIWHIFKEANRQEKARIVFGCGIGPIHTQEIKEVTTSIIKVTTAGFVRDEESYLYACRLYKDHVLKFACDPAVGFVSRWRKERLNPRLNGTTNRIAGLVRENTNEFVPDQSKTALLDFNTSIAKKLASILEPACSSNNLKVDLLHMNAPWIGGDDRLFNRILEKTFIDSSLIRTERSYLTLEALIKRLYTVKASMAMRYHGHIFSMALGIPFLSIDYTGNKGKVQSLVERIGYNQWSEKWENINPNRATQKLNTLIKEREYWSDYLLKQTDSLVNLLEATYKEVFNVNIRELSKQT